MALISHSPSASFKSLYCTYKVLILHVSANNVACYGMGDQGGITRNGPTTGLDLEPIHLTRQRAFGIETAGS